MYISKIVEMKRQEISINPKMLVQDGSLNVYIVAEQPDKSLCFLNVGTGKIRNNRPSGLLEYTVPLTIKSLPKKIQRNIKPGILRPQWKIGTLSYPGKDAAEILATAINYYCKIIVNSKNVCLWVKDESAKEALEEWTGKAMYKNATQWIYYGNIVLDIISHCPHSLINDDMLYLMGAASLANEHPSVKKELFDQLTSLENQSDINRVKARIARIMKLAKQENSN